MATGCTMYMDMLIDSQQGASKAVKQIWSLDGIIAHLISSHT